MSPETRQLVELLISISPWFVFLGALLWSLAYWLREQLDAAPKDRERPREMESRAKRAA